MAEANDTYGMIYQNLIDAGCDQPTTERCMAIVRTGAYLEIIPILSEHRAGLLHSIHSEQKQIDCLDYLIYKLEKEAI